MAKGLTPRALIMTGWLAAFGVAAASFVVSNGMERRPTRSYSPWDLLHFSLLVLGVFVIDRLVQVVPLTGRRMALRILTHAVFATTLSIAAGVMTGAIMGVIDGLDGYQHLINTLHWYVTPHVGRIKLVIIEQLYYFATAAALDAFRRLERKRQAGLRAASLETDLARVELASSRRHVPPEYMRDVFHTLGEVVERDPVAAERLIMLLARFVRHVIDSLSRGGVSIADDVRALQALIELENARAGRQLPLRCALDERELTEPIGEMNLVAEAIARREELSRAHAVVIVATASGIRLRCETYVEATA